MSHQAKVRSSVSSCSSGITMLVVASLVSTTLAAPTCHASVPCLVIFVFVRLPVFAVGGAGRQAGKHGVRVVG